jgi:hypothetical protein
MILQEVAAINPDAYLQPWAAIFIYTYTAELANN